MRALCWAALLTILPGLITTAEAQTRARRGNQEQQAPQSGDVPLFREEKRFPLGKQWVAVSFNNRPFTGVERPGFILNDQYRATGFGGCNSFSATAFPLKEQGIAVGPLALTKRSCDKATMDLERAYFIALRTAAKWDTVQGALVLKSPTGEIRFERSL